MFKIFKTSFSINLNEYDNIGINLEINKVLVVTFAALILGIIFLSVYRKNIKLAVSQLIRHGAKTEEKAKTLGESGLGEAKAVKRMLLGDNLLTKIVARVGEKRYTREEYKALTKEEKENISTVDFSTARFYIREDKAFLSEEVMSRYGASTFNTAIACIFAAIVCFCLVLCMPGILNLVNNLLG